MHFAKALGLMIHSSRKNSPPAATAYAPELVLDLVLSPFQRNKTDSERRRSGPEAGKEVKKGRGHLEVGTPTVTKCTPSLPYQETFEILLARTNPHTSHNNILPKGSFLF